ncbi:MATE family efflux transporter [Peptoniphilus equinus]|uniref:Multidrug export protein MepA n=1 Tax=Peptoniphilus equinus TaxID=3016343 RepID=A0ABY7QTQ0_9FIRM|nr:MATE family efflux transporter [Peptoniphilus equinus]WBW50166.1 MATE family efflux transporter [Peptoniphilus equinus]
MTTNYNELETEPVGKLIDKFALSTIPAMLITHIYNAVDTYFIGSINTQASAAVGVAMSAMAIMQAVGFFFGQGSANSISLHLGHRDLKAASRIASFGFFAAVFSGLLILLLGNIFVTELAYALGSTPTVLPYATAYLSIIFFGAPYQCATLVLNNQLRSQGKAFYAMVGLMTGGVLNIFLDPLFIYTFDMGIAGAALATILSQLVSFTILFHNHKKFDVHLSIKRLKVNSENFNEIVGGGLPSLVRQSVNAVGVLAMNHAAGVYGDAAIAAVSIVGRITLLANAVIIGMGHAFQPICGYNYGAGNYQRVLQGFTYIVKRAVVYFALVSVLLFVFSPQVIDIFIDDPQVIEIGAKTLRFSAAVMAFSSLFMLCTMLMQTIRLAKESSFLSFMRTGGFLIPLVFFLSAKLGILGIQIAQPVSDLLSTAIAVVMTKPLIDSLRRGVPYEKHS